MTEALSALHYDQQNSRSNQLTDRQILQNETTSNHWALFHSHREEVSRLITLTRPCPSARLCVLGAGNCNDLDLAHLERSFSEIHLVDLDSEALLTGTARQSMVRPSRLNLHGGIDVTGVFETMSTLRPGQVSQEGVNRYLRKALDFEGLSFLGSFDTVISTCLLTQLFDSVAFLSGSHHLPSDLSRALRLRHLQLLAELLSPGGVGILVTDVASSDIVPSMADVSLKALPVLMDQLSRRGSMFSGTHPWEVRSLLEEHPLLKSLVHQVQVADPWLWQLTPRRFFLVSGIRFRRRAEGSRVTRAQSKASG